MKVLLVYPEFLVTFWSWKYLLKFVAKKSAFPPLGLLTVAAMLPDSWEKKLIDINVEKLTDENIRWADYVFISAMFAQKHSTKEITLRCKNIGVEVVLGGPILELEEMCEEFQGVSHFFLKEAEDTLPEFLADIENNSTKRVYSSQEFPDIAKSPIPLYELVNPKDYACGFVQWSRGCPFKCTFCNVGVLNGRRWRAKSPTQFLAELSAMHQAGFSGSVQIADDNFVGNMLKTEEMLVKLIEWQQVRGYPFEFTVEAPITIADKSRLMNKMVLANIKKVFLGLETRNKECLIECEKRQNLNRDLVVDVKKIQKQGLLPMSGYIVGFDSDSPTVFVKDTIDFIQESGVVIAMVDVLQAQPGTKLYNSLKKQGRILGIAISNTECYPNFEPQMPVEILSTGYKKILETIYSPKKYYERICQFLKEYNISNRPKKKMSINDFKALMRANLWIGLFGGLRVSYYYWKSLLAVFFSKKPQAFADIVSLQIYGVHFRKVTKEIRKA